MRKPLLRILAVLLALAFVAAACGGDDSSSGSSGTSGGESAFPDKFPEPVTPTKGGVLKMGISKDSNIDCYNGLSYYGISWSLMNFMFRGLYGYPNTVESPETDTLQPDLAADMPEVSDDGLTYTVKLREGLKFSDGSPVTSADVKATYEYMLDPNIQCSTGGPPSSGYYAVIDGETAFSDALTADPKADAHISGITTPDPLTTVFKLTQADGAFVRSLGMGWSFIRKADTPHEILETPPVSVGPYLVTDFVADQKVVVARADNWDANVAAGVPEPDDEDNIDGIELQIGLTDENQLGQIKKNTLDVSYDSGAVTGSNVPAVANDPAYKGRFFSSADASVDYLFFRTDKEPMNNVQLRQAVNWAIDRDNVTRITGGELSRSPWSEIISSNLMAGSEDEDGTVYKFDAEKAKQLVKDSGVTTPIPVTFVHYADPPAPAMAAAIKENLDAVGFKVTLLPQSADVMQGYQADPKNDYDIGMNAWGQDYADAITYFGPLLNCPGGKPTGQNYAQFCDTDYQSQLESISKMPTGQDRTDAWAQLSIDTMKDKAPWAPLTNRRKVNLVSDRVGNFIFGPGKQFYFATYFLKDAS